MINLSVTNLQKPIRIDQYIVDCAIGFNRSAIRKLIDADKVTCNGIEIKQSYQVKPNDKIKIDFDLSSLKNFPKISIPIIYEDSNCIVLDKPAGILTHSKGVFNPEATVASFIRKKISDELVGDRAGIVHRLDRPTAGVIICAKNEASQKWLQKQFALRKVKKTYLAVVSGVVSPNEAIIDVPIARDPKNPKKFKPSNLGKTAQTHYKLIKHNQDYSLLQLYPKTGRTHQIRVHLAHLGHPIIGDHLYSAKMSDRMYLQAKSLEIILPNHEKKVFESKLPFKFKGLN